MNYGITSKPFIRITQSFVKEVLFGKEILQCQVVNLNRSG